MFESLSEKLQGVLRRLKGHGKLNEKHIKEAMREVRLALLEADVNYLVAKDFVKRVSERSLGQEVMRSLTPGQQVVKIVHEELTEVMGTEARELKLTGRPPVSVMLAGLQGSGKTTTAAKLALYLADRGRKPLLVPLDLRRPAAVEQLVVLGRELGIPVYPPEVGRDTAAMAKDAVEFARSRGLDTLILDTAGRLHVDEELMEELKSIDSAIAPEEVLLVADAMTGQDAVNVAGEFDRWLDLTGVILTKLDGDARGGAALSIVSVTEKPIKFAGVGEKTDALELFHPDRMASRILGMGDVLTLVEKAQAQMDEEKALELQKKILTDTFTLDDFRDQLRSLRKMGGMEDLLAMIPGMGRLKDLKKFKPDDSELVKIEAIINSMTPEERRRHNIINASRRRRIATGSGTTVADVNALLKNYTQVEKMMRKMKKISKKPGAGLPFHL